MGLRSQIHGYLGDKKRCMVQGTGGKGYERINEKAFNLEPGTLAVCRSLGSDLAFVPEDHLSMARGAGIIVNSNVR